MEKIRKRIFSAKKHQRGLVVVVETVETCGKVWEKKHQRGLVVVVEMVETCGKVWEKYTEGVGGGGGNGGNGGTTIIVGIAEK